MAILRRQKPCARRLSSALSRVREGKVVREKMRNLGGMRRVRGRRTALLALAMLFLAVAWLWDGLAAIGRALAGFIPWARFKEAFASLVDRLPAALVLLIFLVPFLIVEPLLVVATIAIAMGYVVV